MSSRLEALYRFRQIIEDRIWDEEHPEGPRHSRPNYRFTDEEQKRVVAAQKADPDRNLHEIVKECCPGYLVWLADQKLGYD